jgi:hypothetical protein
MPRRRAQSHPGFYGHLDASFATWVRKRAAINSEVITEVAKHDLTRIETILDLQYKIACYHVWAFGTPMHPRTDLTQLLFSAFHKNLFGFFSSLELARMGLFGPANVLLRQVWEWLVLGKFCSLSQDSGVLERWIDGESIALGRHVFSRVGEPDMGPIRDLWSDLCRFAHATKFSHQISFDVRGEHTLAGTFDTIAVIYALLECNYLLLNRHLITPTLIYYARRYCENYRVGEHKQDLRVLFREARKFIAPELRQAVRSYRLAWTIT